MRLPSRRTLWLSAVTLLVGIVVCGWLLVPRSQVTQENFDQIHDGMSFTEVTAILGASGGVPVVVGKLREDETEAWRDWEVRSWANGPNIIFVKFTDGVVVGKRGIIATAWQTLQWYAKKCPEKVGIKWE